MTKELKYNLKMGFSCPKCHGNTNTFRHPYAQKWCSDCGYVLRKEGDISPYVYEDHTQPTLTHAEIEAKIGPFVYGGKE
jgi:hypothetical protein